MQGISLPGRHRSLTDPASSPNVRINPRRWMRARGGDAMPLELHFKKWSPNSWADRGVSLAELMPDPLYNLWQKLDRNRSGPGAMTS